MRQINPFVAALLLLLVLAFVIVRLTGAKDSLGEAKAQLQESRTMAERIVALKESWGSSPQKASRLQKLLASPQLRTAGIEKTTGRDTVNIVAENIEMKAAAYLLNKLFNDTYTIRSMEVVRVDSAHLRLKVEVSE